MAQSLAETLHDRPGEKRFEVQTGGEIVKPFLNPINQLVDECKLHVYNNGWKVTATDPANVGAVQIHLRSDAFDSYETGDDVTYGVNISLLRQQVKRARMHNDDELIIQGFEEQLDTTVSRDSSAGTIVFENWMRTIDPDSVRQEPDIKTHPTDYDLEYYSTTFEVADILDVLQAIVTDYEYVRIGSRGDDLAIDGKTDEDYYDGGAIRVEGAGHDTDAYSSYSTDYLKDILTGLKQSKVETVTLWYGADIPMFLEAERTINDESVMDLMYMLAPRIQS